ncbi:type II secretion system protein [Candidatus Nomurabacteria bacterium]|nr:type II secretion system protein [Candidatus Nomurabacteria bacterium]
MFKNLFHNLKKKNKQKGFTVIEFIVIMIIFAIMASISLYNFQGFDDSTNINNLALDIALEIKRAQTLGSSSIDASSGDKQAMSVIFEPDTGNTFLPRILIVREIPQAVSDILGIINTGDIIDRRSDIMGGSITGICIHDGSGCSSSDYFHDEVAISFRRPYTEPLITSSSCTGSVTDLRSDIQYLRLCQGTLEIHLESTSGTRKRTIIIEPTGNIFTRNS